MAGQIFVNPQRPFYDNSGRPLKNAVLTFGEINKDPLSFPRSFYNSVGNDIGNILTLTSSGVQPFDIFLPDDQYSLRIETERGSLVREFSTLEGVQIFTDDFQEIVDAAIESKEALDQAIADNAAETKTYRDEAEAFRNEAEAFRDETDANAAATADDAIVTNNNRLAAETAKSGAELARDQVAADAQNVVDAVDLTNGLLGSGLGTTEIVDGELFITYIDTVVNSVSIVDGDLTIDYI